MRTVVKGLAAAGTLALFAGPAHAVLIGGVEFPQGSISFADAVHSYVPVVTAGEPTAPHQGATNALGAPDNVNPNACASQATCRYVSLGAGGALTLRFLDNVLTGSGTAAPDLWIFEIGADIEATTVEVSENGVNWTPVGGVGGATAGIDIDAFGFTTLSALSWVRLTDVANLGDTFGPTVGADIDAVGAISTRAFTPNPVPEPSTWALMIMGLGGVGLTLRRSHRRRERP